MTLTTNRTEIKTVLEGITDIGVVHDYERLTTDWKTYLDKFKPATKAYIRGWTIRREKTPEEYDELADNFGRRKYRFVIRGFASVDDANASSKTFDDLIETICDTFRPLTVNNLNGKAMGSGLIQTEIVEDRMFGSVLCHYCELSLEVEERKSI